MDQDKTVIFEKFAKQAAKRMEERKKHRKESLKIGGDEDMVMEIRGLSDTELNDCFEFSEEAIEVDRYTIYMASPTLQNAAECLVREGKLNAGQAYKITECSPAWKGIISCARYWRFQGPAGMRTLR